MLALPQARVLECGELVESGGDEDRAGKQAARRSHAGIEQGQMRQAELQDGREHSEGEPDERVAGGDDEGRHNALALVRGGDPVDLRRAGCGARVVHRAMEAERRARSPDGRRLAVVLTKDGGSQLYTANPDGSGVTLEHRVEDERQVAGHSTGQSGWGVAARVWYTQRRTAKNPDQKSQPERFLRLLNLKWWPNQQIETFFPVCNRLQPLLTSISHLVAELH